MEKYLYVICTKCEFSLSLLLLLCASRLYWPSANTNNNEARSTEYMCAGRLAPPHNSLSLSSLTFFALNTVVGRRRGNVHVNTHAHTHTNTYILTLNGRYGCRTSIYNNIIILICVCGSVVCA